MKFEVCCWSANAMSFGFMHCACHVCWSHVLCLPCLLISCTVSAMYCVCHVCWSHALCLPCLLISCTVSAMSVGFIVYTVSPLSVCFMYGTCHMSVDLVYCVCYVFWSHTLCLLCLLASYTVPGTACHICVSQCFTLIYFLRVGKDRGKILNTTKCLFVRIF